MPSGLTWSVFCILYSLSLSLSPATNVFLSSLANTDFSPLATQEQAALPTTSSAIPELTTLLATVPLPFDTIEAVLRCPIKYEEAYNNMLQNEMHSYNHLLSLVHHDISTLIHAEHGTMAMTDTVKALKQSLLQHHTVPNAWKTQSYTTLSTISIGQYLTNLTRRIEFIKLWIKKNKPPPMIWLGAFFFVQTFLNSTLQNYSRKRTINIDHLGWQTTVCKKTNYDSAPRNGIYIHGLSFECGQWNAEEGLLVDQHKGQWQSKCPVLLMKAIPKEEQTRYPFFCPVYRTKERTETQWSKTTNYVLDVQIPTQHSQEYWEERGCALIVDE